MRTNELVAVRKFLLPDNQGMAYPEGNGQEGTVFMATDQEATHLVAAGLARRNDPADRETKPSKAKLETK